MTILRETACTQTHICARSCTSSWHIRGGAAALCTFVLASFYEVLYLPSFVFRKAARKGVRSLFSPSPVLFTTIFFSPVLPRLMAHFKRRNCSQFISGMQSATQRCARHPQSPNTISSPIKQHQRQSSTLRIPRVLKAPDFHFVAQTLVAFQLLHSRHPSRMINPYPNNRDECVSILSYSDIRWFVTRHR